MTTFATPQGARKVSATTYVRYPAQFRMDARGPEGLIVQTFDNGAVWVADDGGPRDAPPQFAGILKAGVQRDIISMLLAVNDNRVTTRRGADVILEGKPVPSLEVDLAPAAKSYPPLRSRNIPARRATLRRRAWRSRDGGDVLRLPRRPGNEGCFPHPRARRRAAADRAPHPDHRFQCSRRAITVRQACRSTVVRGSQVAGHGSRFAGRPS